MKRRLTKNRIRKAEGWLAEELREYLAARANGDARATEESLSSICSALTSLLRDYLVLRSAWPYKERWLDGISSPKLSFQRPSDINVRGRMVWGSCADTGGNQWEEPFEAIVRIEESGRRFISYELSFGHEYHFWA